MLCVNFPIFALGLRHGHAARADGGCAGRMRAGGWSHMGSMRPALAALAKGEKGPWPRQSAPIWCILGQIGHAMTPPAACTNGHPRARCLNGAHQAHRGAHFRAKKRPQAPARRMGCVVTGRETAESVRFGAVTPCVGGVRAVSGPGRVSGRSARRLGRAGCRRDGGEGPGRVAGIGRGAVLEKLNFGAFWAKSAMPRRRNGR